MGPAQPERQTVLIVEDDGELRRLMVTLLEDEHLDAIECESAEAALAIMLMGDRHITMLVADIRLPGVMDGIDLAWDQAALAVPSRDSHLGSAPGIRPATPARDTLHGQTVSAARRARDRRTSPGVFALGRACPDQLGLSAKTAQGRVGYATKERRSVS
jgi:hypothetical protein